MNVADLRTALAKWPDDTEVMVINDLNNDLDGDIAADIAINHPSTYVQRKSWHWEDESGIWPDGQSVIVIY